MEVRMLKHPLTGVVVKCSPKSHKVLVDVLGLLGKAGIGVYGVMLEKDRLKFYVREGECERTLRVLDKVVRGDVEFSITREVGMITISGGSRRHSVNVDVLLAPVKSKVKIFDLIRSDNSVQLFIELRNRGMVFEEIVKRVTDGFRMTKV